VAGVLESGEGAIFPLDRPYVIGRDPLGDDAVRNAHASPIVVHDDQHVSRVHAYVTIDGGSVFVRDASTPGGTFIAAPGAETWTQISTTPIELELGWTLRVGTRILTYRSADTR
jgi:pSer/pThr/pTyr-binding forkhead associated (FHA) protein